MRSPWLPLPLLVSVALPVLARPPGGSLADAAPLASPRAAHTATALPDGTVLVAGGFAQEGTAGAAERFVPASGRFEALPPMAVNRHSHTATSLRDGRVLLAGGLGAGSTTLASAELFDPRTGTFTPTGSLRTARAGHVAVLLEDGQVLVAGGLGTGWEFLSSAELYDPATGRFSPTGPMGEARESHAAVRLADGRVLVVGGHRGRHAGLELLGSAEVYQPGARAFRPLGSMGSPRHKHDAVLLRDGRVLVTGGADRRDAQGVYSSTELLDPRTGRFTPGPPMRLGRYKHQGSSVVLPDGSVLLAGGAPRAERFDPTTGTFSLVEGPARMAGQFSAAAPLPGGGVLISGGYGDGTGPRAAAWVYRP